MSHKMQSKFHCTIYNYLLYNHVFSLPLHGSQSGKYIMWPKFSWHFHNITTMVCFVSHLFRNHRFFLSIHVLHLFSKWMISMEFILIFISQRRTSSNQVMWLTLLTLHFGTSIDQFTDEWIAHSFIWPFPIIEMYYY